MEASPDKMEKLGDMLSNQEMGLRERFECLYTLRNLRGKEAVKNMAKVYRNDPSTLLKHETAYMMGQLGDESAIDCLIEGLNNHAEDQMFRHECGEALGAIGNRSQKVIQALNLHTKDPKIDVAETCQIALARLNWLEKDKASEERMLSPNPYHSTDPAPPHLNRDVKFLKEKLVDESCPIFERYRAMFELRNNGSQEAIKALCEGLRCKSALLRHEVAFVLGQTKNPLAIKSLTKNLEELYENPMVRHECAFALGVIGTDECRKILTRFLSDPIRVVRESAEVKLNKTAIMVTNEKLDKLGDILANPETPVKRRFQILYTLRNIRGKEAVKNIAKTFKHDPSILLKHECAYMMGQMTDESAIDYLIEELKNDQEDQMFRHECGEALGAIGNRSDRVIKALNQFSKDTKVDVAETCQLAIARLNWVENDKAKEEKFLSVNPYNSTDPAPPHVHKDIEFLREKLCDETSWLFERYRAMFELRNNGSDEAILALGEGLKSQSALLRHEVAFVLGQTRSTVAIKALHQHLEELYENPMVRHECAFALGEIGTDECKNILTQYLNDSMRVVRESCEVKLNKISDRNTYTVHSVDELLKQ